MKNSFIPVRRKADNGETYKDEEGAFYLEDHDHEALEGKEFCNPSEAVQCVRDWERSTNKKFEGELILLNVISF